MRPTVHNSFQQTREAIDLAFAELLGAIQRSQTTIEAARETLRTADEILNNPPGANDEASFDRPPSG